MIRDIGSRKQRTGPLSSKAGFVKTSDPGAPAAAPVAPSPEAVAVASRITTTTRLSGEAIQLQDQRRLELLVQGVPGGTEALQGLYDKGLLDARKGEGRILLTYLLELAGTNRELGGPTGAEFAVGVMRDLADPDHIGQGQGTFSCAAATAQAILAARDPEEYARLVTRLVVDGQVRTEGGDLLVADGSGFAMDEGRSPTEDLLQQTFMSFVSPPPSPGGTGVLGKMAEAVGDVLGRGVFGVASRARLGSPEAGAGGLTPDQYSRLMAALTDERYLPIDSAALSPASVRALLLETLDREGGVPVGVAVPDPVTGAPSLHAIQVTGVAGQMVSYQDPGSGSVGTMTLAEFAQSMKLIAVSADIMERLSKKGLLSTVGAADVASRQQTPPVVDQFLESNPSGMVIQGPVV